MQFFEIHVRPLLAEHCIKCHGPKKQFAGLRLDSRQNMLAGGDSGPAIVPRHPAKSLLISAIRYGGELEMPPDGRLEDRQIAVLEKWVGLGAPWPAESVDQQRDLARSHWAYQPIRRPETPQVRNREWCRSTIDDFILARLEAAELCPSPDAERGQLIRRVTYDLTGLPPTREEILEFERDTRDDAYARLVDRLLASPQYGEQAARHWLDVARYSDTKGYVYGREERFFVHASVYRDWVVRAFNENLPYDRFLVLQIAADMAAPADRPALAAMGFLTLGRRFLGVTQDIIDDRIDVVARGMMGLTVACARCHDHKYDPIPTADYYSLYGVFQNCFERTVQLAEPLVRDAEYDVFKRTLATRQEKLREKTALSRTVAADRVRERIGEYIVAQTELERYPDENFSVIVGPEDLIPTFVRRWEAYLADPVRATDPVFAPWVRFGELLADKFAEQSAHVLQKLRVNANLKINPLVLRAFEQPPASMREVAERYGRLLGEVDRNWKAECAVTGATSSERSTLTSDADVAALRQVLYGPESPCVVPDEGLSTTEFFYDTDTCVALWKLQGEVDRLLINSPLAPPHAVTLADKATLREQRIFRRGNAALKGAVAPRQFLKVIAGDSRRPFATGSGRRELAEAIVNPENPLTSRVWVNRVWQHHFGAGLVRTPSDFGVRAQPPSHPELLDWLAGRFITGGWNVKELHRLIVLSHAYQQQSAFAEQPGGRDLAQRIDPENRLLWRMTSRRLSFEELRDTLLAASGLLDLHTGGRSAALFGKGPINRRRTLYGLIDRQFLPDTLRLFDMANPDLHCPQRSETTVPQQALFAMNHPFVADCARAIVERTSVLRCDYRTEEVRQWYQIIYQREPTAAQLRSALVFLEYTENPEELGAIAAAADWQYGYGAFDEATGRVRTFERLPHFNGMAWQGGMEWPDGALGWVQLTAEGGHPGNDLEHAAVRRWTAPRDAVISIESMAKHEVAEGDGVRCRIVSSRQGVLGSAIVHNAEVELNVFSIAVQGGEMLDFVVDLNSTLSSDQFMWSPLIREHVPAEAALPEAHSHDWEASRDFGATAAALLKPREQFVQVLLLANELMFVD